MAFMFVKLIVYQKAISYADCICGITEKFPRGYGFLADQLNRASVSIAANIAEGNGRHVTSDCPGFPGIVRGLVREISGPSQSPTLPGEIRGVQGTECRSHQMQFPRHRTRVGAMQPIELVDPHCASGKSGNDIQFAAQGRNDPPQS